MSLQASSLVASLRLRACACGPRLKAVSRMSLPDRVSYVRETAPLSRIGDSALIDLFATPGDCREVASRLDFVSA